MTELASLQFDSPLKLTRCETIKTGFKSLDRMTGLDITWYERQLRRMAAGKSPKKGLGPWGAVAGTLLDSGLQAFKKKRA